MTMTKKIEQHINRLPEILQAEVMDFIEYLESKVERAEADWLNLSLSSAMRDMEDEQAPYTVNDLKERFN